MSGTMASASTVPDALVPARQGLRQRFLPRAVPSCTHARGWWRQWLGKPARVLLQGSYYCLDYCLEGALVRALGETKPVPARPATARRIPLGLVLLDRRQLTTEQLQVALATQRAAGRGRLGEWLQVLGFVSEGQVTAALARQWSCPVLRADASAAHLGPTPQIPLSLLESFRMIPVAYVEATRALHIAFSEGLEYGVLYAIEQMLDCRTEACLAAPSLVRGWLQTLCSGRRENEARIEHISDFAELGRIVRSYSRRLAAREIRAAWCGPDYWVRLFRESASPVDLFLRAPEDAPRPGNPKQRLVSGWQCFPKYSID